MLGILLNSLTHRLKKEDEEWKRQNSVRKQYSYSSIESVLVAMSRRPVFYTACILPIYVVIVVLFNYIGLWSTVYRVNEYDSLPAFEYFSVLVGAQVTIAGLIYPIVFAFVSIILQRQSSEKTVLRIYIRDSGAILFGTSSILLVLTMAIEYIALPRLHKDQVLAITTVNSVWFCVNLVGTMRFLYRTSLFLRVDIRRRIITQFTINVILPDHILQKLRNHILHTIKQEKLLPTSGYGFGENLENIDVSFGRYYVDEGKAILKKRFVYDSVLTEVYFRTLSWAVLIWMTAAQTKSYRTEKEELYELRFPVEFDSIYSGENTICERVGPIGLGAYEKLLVKLSFRYKNSLKLDAGMSVDDVLQDLISEARRYLKEGQQKLFAEAITELTNLHALAIRASEFQNGTGVRDNYLNVLTSVSIVGRPVHQNWARQYYELIDDSIGKLKVDQRYFDKLGYVANVLVAQTGRKANKEILLWIMNYPLSLFLRLSEWWERETEKQGFYQHGLMNMYRLDPPLSQMYTSVLTEFVGGWTQLKNHYIAMLDDEKHNSWEDKQLAGSLFVKHLDETIYFLAVTAYRGDIEGASWMGNVLQLWWSELEYKYENRHYYISDTSMLTVRRLNMSWEDAKSSIDIDTLGVNAGDPATALFSAIFENYWIDNFVIVLSLLSEWSAIGSLENSVSGNVLTSLVKGKRLKEGGGYTADFVPIRNINDLFVSYIRQYFAEGGYAHGYREDLNEKVERLLKVSEEKMVSGRLYSSSYMEGLEDLSDGQLFLLVIYSVQKWRVGRSLDSSLEQLADRDPGKLQELIGYFRKWKERLSSDEFRRFENLYDYISRNNEADFATSVEQLESILAALIEWIDNLRDRRIYDADIDETRIQCIGEWVSTEVRENIETMLPFGLFVNRRYTRGEGLERKMIISNMKKGEFTAREFEQRAANEREFYNQFIGENIASSLLSIVLLRLRAPETEANNEQIYLGKLRNLASEIRNCGATPILLVENRTKPSWLYSWYNSQYEDQLGMTDSNVVWKHNRKIRVSGYIGSVDDVEVYDAPIPSGASYVLAKESLRMIEMKEDENGSLVQVRWQSAGRKHIDLIFSWSFEIDVGEYPCGKFVYGEENGG